MLVPDAATAMAAAHTCEQLHVPSVAKTSACAVQAARAQPLVWSVGQSILEPTVAVAAFVDLKSYAATPTKWQYDSFCGDEEDEEWAAHGQQQLSCGVLLHRHSSACCHGD